MQISTHSRNFKEKSLSLVMGTCQKMGVHKRKGMCELSRISSACQHRRIDSQARFWYNPAVPVMESPLTDRCYFYELLGGLVR